MKSRRKRAIFPEEKTVAFLGICTTHEEVRQKPKSKIPSKKQTKSPKGKGTGKPVFSTRKTGKSENLKYAKASNQRKKCAVPTRLLLLFGNEKEGPRQAYYASNLWLIPNDKTVKMPLFKAQLLKYLA